VIGPYRLGSPGWEKRRQRSCYERCQRPTTPPQRSAALGAALLFVRFARRASEHGRSWRDGVNRTSTGVAGAERRSPAQESSGYSGARAVGRLQKSVRDILPSLAPSFVRAVGVVSDSTDRPLYVTGSRLDSDDKGVERAARKPTSKRAAARHGSNAGHQADGRRSGPNELHCPNPAEENRGPGRGRTAQSWHQPGTLADAGFGDPAPGLFLRQRVPEVMGVRFRSLSRRAQRVCSQRHAQRARHAVPDGQGRSWRGNTPRHPGGGSGSANCTAHLGEPNPGEDGAFQCGARGSSQAQKGRRRRCLPGRSDGQAELR
jgi:hypothetical protein